MNIVNLALDALPPGSVLARAACDADGRLLLAAGTPLTAECVAALRRRGVQSVDIDLPGEGAAVPPAQLAEERRLRLQHLFRHTLRKGELNPLMYIVPHYRQEARP